MRPFEHLKEGLFLARPNRFSVECIVDKRRVRAYLPNSGRLWELLLPGSTLYLVPQDSPKRKLDYTSVAVEKEGLPVLLHTHLNNTVVRYLLGHNRIPGFEGAEVVQQEVLIGDSRFDFLLEYKGREVLLEVKSCTLFHGEIAMFPDAVTLRGRRHLEELAVLSSKGWVCAMLFIAHAPHIRYFVPDYHTDLAFARTLLSVSQDLIIKAISVSWKKKTLVLKEPVRELIIPWDVIRDEACDRGSYIIILRLRKGRRIPVGDLGTIRFDRGYYLYVGSARKNLSQRIARHSRRLKTFHWHIDHLRRYAEYHGSLPVRASMDLECELASALGRISQWDIPNFGSSDCRCQSHLFGMREDPFLSPQFINLLLDFRTRRLKSLLKGRANLAL